MLRQNGRSEIDAIFDAVRVNWIGATYIRFYETPGRGKSTRIPLDLASV